MRNRQRGDAGMRNIAKSQRLMGVLALLLALDLVALAVLAVLGHHVLVVFGVGLDVVAFIIFVVVVIVFVAVGRTRGARARQLLDELLLAVDALGVRAALLEWGASSATVSLFLALLPTCCASLAAF